MITQDDIRRAARLEHLQEALRAAKRRVVLLSLALLAEIGVLVWMFVVWGAG